MPPAKQIEQKTGKHMKHLLVYAPGCKSIKQACMCALIAPVPHVGPNTQQRNPLMLYIICHMLQAAKLCNNLACAVEMAAISEVLALGAAVGLE